MSHDPSGTTDSASTEQSKRLPGSNWGAVLGLGILVIAGVVVLIASFNLAGTISGSKSPEVSLTLWIIVGAGILLIILMAVALVSFLIDGNGTRRGALALPEGSVSAAIALLLLLVFTIFTIYLYGQLKDSEAAGQASTGLTMDEVKNLPQDRLVAITAVTPAPTPPTFNVQLSSAHTASDDFAKTAAGTVATLLTAVAGFYFGQRATTSGIRVSKDNQAHLQEGRIQGSHEKPSGDGRQ